MRLLTVFSIALSALNATFGWAQFTDQIISVRPFCVEDSATGFCKPEDATFKWSGSRANTCLYREKSDGQWVLINCIGTAQLTNFSGRIARLRLSRTEWIGGVRVPVQTLDEMDFRKLDEPRGLYVLTPPLLNTNLGAQNAFRTEFYGGTAGVNLSRYVSGVAINVVWSQIHPNPDQFNWNQLDMQIDDAVRNGKQISIGVRTGKFAPSWINAEKSMFVIGPQGGSIRTECAAIYAPWDDEYILAYQKMMSALASHLQQKGPATWNAIRIVKITGINQATNEIRLPTGKLIGTCEGDAVAREYDAAVIWQSLGYRPSLILNAWKEFVRTTKTEFPNKLVGIEVLENNDFPAINELGQIVSRLDSTYIDLKPLLIEEGMAQLAGRFSVQWDGLSLGPVAPSVVEAGAKRAIVGWQTNAFLGLPGSSCSLNFDDEKVECTSSAYSSLLNNGMLGWTDTSLGSTLYKSQFLEVWLPNLKNFPNEAKLADDALK